MAALLRELGDLKRRLAAVERYGPLRAAGIGVSPDGMTVDRSLSVAGDLSVTGDAAFSGDTIIGGNAAITGTLSLPAGIIDNAALAQPVVYRSGVANEPGIAVATTQTVRAVASLVVPENFTTANVVVLGSASVVNSTTSTQYAYLTAYVGINGEEWAWGGGQRVTLAAGFTGSILAPLIRTRTGLTGGDAITAYVKIWASAALAADSAAWAGVEASVTFSRDPA
ncbi:MAG TPA: hypothetical protein VIO38_09160 [Rariglobus sp.]